MARQDSKRGAGRRRAVSRAARATVAPMVRSTRRLLLLGIVALAACGDDDGPVSPPLPPGDRLILRLSASDDGGYELSDGDPVPV